VANPARKTASPLKTIIFFFFFSDSVISFHGFWLRPKRSQKMNPSTDTVITTPFS
jgi:hypothetical protein